MNDDRLEEKKFIEELSKKHIPKDEDDLKALVELMREDHVMRQAQLGYTIAGIILMGLLLFLIWLKI